MHTGDLLEYILCANFYFFNTQNQVSIEILRSSCAKTKFEHSRLAERRLGCRTCFVIALILCRFLPVLVTVRHSFVYQSLALETFVLTATLSCGLPIGIYWIIWFYSARLTWCCQPNSYTSGGHCVVRGRSRPKSVAGSPS